jgi:hypothetical protein
VGSNISGIREVRERCFCSKSSTSQSHRNQRLVRERLSEGLHAIQQRRLKWSGRGRYGLSIPCPSSFLHMRIPDWWLASILKPERKFRCLTIAHFFVFAPTVVTYVSLLLFAPIIVEWRRTCPRSRSTIVLEPVRILLCSPPPLHTVASLSSSFAFFNPQLAGHSHFFCGYPQ